ncbi:hypothetical protein [Thioclava sp. F34-6]|uniref:hypothetical protein n=1 Tax=Thioclava sp. F34-6 TaxID=1973003 RepID=UPI00143ADB9F|nr:hypothetical protein [Thioclava sp. F34-6]
MNATLDILLSISSAMAIGVIAIILTLLAIDVVTPMNEIPEHYSYCGAPIENLFFLYGTIFQPGVIISAIFVFYGAGRLSGLSKSYLLEMISIFIAIQSAVSFYLL